MSETKYVFLDWDEINNKVVLVLVFYKNILDKTKTTLTYDYMKSKYPKMLQDNLKINHV